MPVHNSHPTPETFDASFVYSSDVRITAELPQNVSHDQRYHLLGVTYVDLQAPPIPDLDLQRPEVAKGVPQSQPATSLRPVAASQLAELPSIAS